MSKEKISKETKNTLQNCWVMTTNHELDNENRKLKEAITEILDKIISDIEKRLDDKKIKLNLTSAAKDYIINNSFDEKYGARPIKRFVSRNLETLLATEIINDNIKFGETVNIDVKDDHLIIK